MAVFTRRERTTVTVEYVLPNPVNHVELQKALDAARQDLGDNARYDNTIEVKAWDDEVIVSFEKPGGDR